MSETEPVVYLNGRYVAKSSACLCVEDRGALFADGVYEVVRYYAGRPFELDRHLDRLRRSLAGIRLALPDAVASLRQISDTVVKRNGLTDAKVYWQVTRGAAPRAHVFPMDAEPSVLVMAYPAEPIDEAPSEPAALGATLHPDRRWADCWIKSLMLLPNVLARQAAEEQGAQEAILHAGNRVTEGSATSVMMVEDGAVWTHPLDGAILGSITREVLLECAEALDIPAHESSFTVQTMRTADEVLLCGTTTHVAAVTHIDEAPVGDARPGPVARQLHAALMERVDAQCLSSARR
jgi:D-alanine transaminase